jgi:hypothetical protein
MGIARPALNTFSDVLDLFSFGMTLRGSSKVPNLLEKPRFTTCSKCIKKVIKTTYKCVHNSRIKQKVVIKINKRPTLTPTLAVSICSTQKVGHDTKQNNSFDSQIIYRSL